MNGFLTRLFTGLLVVWCTQLAAQPTFTISPENVLVDQGNTFTVNVTVNNFADVASMQFPISWDAAVASFVEITNLNTTDVPGLSMNSLGVPGSGNAPDNQIVLSWNHPSFEGLSLADGTVLFSITLQGEIGGTTLLQFDPNLPQSIEILNALGQDLGFTGNDSMITVNGSGGGGGGPSGDFTLSVPDVTANQGDQVCLPVTVAGFDNILGMQFSINYNASALTFDMSQNFNLAGLSAGLVGNPSPGNITVSWTDPNVVGLTVADGTAIFELCFTVGSQTSTVSFSGTPTPVEVTDGDENNVAFNSESGTVTVNGGGGPTGDFTLNLPDVTANQGDQVCLPVTVSGFDDILGMQFSINYNASALTFDMAQNFNLAGLSAGLVGNPSPGNITVSWTDPNVTGISVADGTAIFELCFTVGSQTSTVSFSGTPTPVEVTDGDENNVPFNSESGTVTVNGGGGPTGFTLSLPDVTANQGDQVCLPVTVSGFDDILGMQFSINYNSSALTFDMAQNFNLAGLSAGLVGNPSPGNITVSWTDPNVTGISVADGTAIFELCFTVGSQTSTVSFSGSPTPVEVTDGDENNVPFNSESGTVTVDGGGGPTGFTLSLPDVNANQGDQVCLPVTVFNFDDILGMQFSINYDASLLTFDMAQNFTLAGLSAGLVGNPSPGNITVSWTDPNVEGITVADGTAIFELCFTVTGSQTTTVSFSGSPTPVEITDGAEQSVPFNSESGTITIGGGGGPEGFTLSLPDVTVDQGDQICLPVTVNDFENILGMQFSINYNSSVLTFDMAQNFTLPGLSAGLVGNPSPGNITVSWTDPNVEGITIADGTAIFEICFTVTGSQTSTVSFSGSPTPIEVTDGDENSVPFNSESGTVTVNAAPLVGFGLILTDEDACIGDSFCMDVTTNDFADIQGMQFTMNFSTADLSLVEVTNFSADLFGLTLSNFNTTTPGVITFQWDNTNGTGINLPNGTVLFSLCFSRTSDEQTTVQFSGTPTPIEIIDGNEEVVPFQSAGGTVECQPDELTIDDVSIVNLTCADIAVGSVTINAVSGGSGDYSYEWSNGNTTNSITGLVAGTYGVTVTDNQLDLMVVGTYEVTSPPLLTVEVQAINNILCAGESTGAITIQAGGGVPGYTYDWSGSLPDNVTSQMNLPAGSYSVTVTDQNGCIRPLNNIQVNELNDPLTLTCTTTNIGFNGNGAVNITVSGGQPGYTYDWSNGATTEDLTGLENAGEYCVTVTDAFGCTVTDCKDVLEDLRITGFSIEDACADSPTGAVDITVAGGTGPGTYTFTWQRIPGTFISSNEDISGVEGGAYSVLVEDQNGNTVVGNFVVNTLSPLGATETITPATSGNNGTISLSVAGGEPGYTYSWATGQTTANLTNLTTGEYCVTVTDNAGCTYEECFFVPAAPLGGSATTNNVTCNGDQDGTATLSLTGGVLPFDITINPGGMMMTSNNGQVDVSNLAPGTYTYMVTDAQGSNFSDMFVIGEPAPMNYTVDAVNDTEDAGGTGSITLMITGGTSPYDVSWNVQANGPQIIQLGGGTYTPTIEDANGCILTGSIEIGTLTEEATIEDAACAGDENGSVTTTVSGGTADYQYSWTAQGGGPVISTDPALTNVGPGTYFVVITDATGASIVRMYTIGLRSDFTANAMILSNFNNFGVSCADAADGELQAVVNNTGQSTSFSYEWELDGNMVGTTALLSNAAAGDYTLLVIDDFNCVVEASVELNAPSELGLTASVQNIGCDGDRDGQVFAMASGGVNTIPYTYSWSNGFFGPQIGFLAANDYTVTVTDANGCTASETYTVEEPEPLMVMVEAEPTTDNCNGTARVVVLGGTPPYNYDWQNVPNPMNEALMTDLCHGEYFVQVTDSRGCESSVVSGIVDNKEFPCFDDRVVITPDGNGSNDEFIIFCIGDLVDNHLEIYNRWGQLVFEVDNYDNSWEGTTMNGDELPAGPYYWVLEYLGPDSETIQVRGSLTIVRE